MTKQRLPKGQRLLIAAINDFDSTKTALASRLGMSIEQLRHIEAGRRQPTLTQAVAIRDKLSIPVTAWV